MSDNPVATPQYHDQLQEMCKQTNCSVKYSSRSCNSVESKSFFYVSVTFPSFISFKRLEITSKEEEFVLNEIN